MSFNFICPVCGEALCGGEKTLKCINNHSFDVAKQGYVNLLQSQKSSKKRHGDDSLMIRARKDFLEKGYYNSLCDGITDVLKANLKPSMTVADLGCGECWYTARILGFLEEQGISAEVCGIDISKQALIYGAKRCSELHLAVASTAELPLADKSCDAVISVFAPCSASEIYRVLKDDGVWIKAFPLEKHLMGLKSVIYEKPYENKVNRNAPENFAVSRRKEISREITLDSSEDILNLFRMTPYYYKTSAEDQRKISGLSHLSTETEFGIYAYTKL